MRLARTLIVALALAASRTALAENASGASPAAAGGFLPGSRVVRTFDFEERHLGNYENIPMFWAKVAGHGYPAYSNGKFDANVARSPGHSFKLEIDGGSAAFQYSPGKITINPSADYYVLAFVKTSNLKHAKAQISAWFADHNGKLILESGVHSRAYASPTPTVANGAMTAENKDDWHVLHLYLPGDKAAINSGAKSMVIQVGLLQPQQLAENSSAPDLGKFALYRQDIKGAARFDDIVVIQLPRLSVSVPAAVHANIFQPGQQIELDLSVSDLPSYSEDGASRAYPSAIIRLTDPDGLLYAAQTFTAAATPNAPWTHRYRHAHLPPGLYTATLDVVDASKTDAQNGGTLIARRQTRFLCLPPQINKLDRPAAEFGFTLLGAGTRNGAAGAELWPQLQHILRHTQAGLIQVPVWRRDMSEDGLLRRDPPLDSLLAMLQRLDIRAIANFSEMPAALSSKIREDRIKRAENGQIADLLPPIDSVLALYDADPSLWRPYVSFLLARYANRIDWWEFGSHAAPYSGTIAATQAARRFSEADARYPKLYAKAAPEMAALLNHPSMVVPWNALFEFDPKQYPGAGLDLRLPANIKPSQLPTYIENFKQALAAGAPGATGAATKPAGLSEPGGAPVILAHIDPLDEKTYARNARLADFAQRIVYTRAANPSAILIDLPMTTPLGGQRSTASGVGGPRAEPNELMLVYRTLAGALGNSLRSRELPVAPGLKAFLFERPAGPTIVLWNESAAEERAHVDLPLGSQPRLIDLWGNAKKATVNPQTHLTSLDITTTPIILDQIESKTLELQASFALSARTFPSGAGAVRTEVLLTNPYDEILVGTLKLTLPHGWTMDPSSINVAVPPGATLRRAVTIRYPYSQLAGTSTISGYLTSEGARRCEFSYPIAVTSEVVELDASSQLLPNGDLVVQQVITNISQTPLNAQAYAQVPGYPRQQRYLLELAPGQTTIKRFVFPVSSYTGATKETNPADIAAALEGKTAAVGLKQNDGRTLINKSLPLQ